MEVDWTSNALRIYNSITKEEIPAYLFVAVLPCNYYTYVEMFLDHDTENWILAHIHAYQYFGGVNGELYSNKMDHLVYLVEQKSQLSSNADKIIMVADFNVRNSGLIIT